MPTIMTMGPLIIFGKSDGSVKNTLVQFVMCHNGVLNIRIVTHPPLGIQGALPSHPDLLDALALEFMESNWDIKQLIKKMVLSKTYRQTSKASPELLEKDPKNIFLARSNRYRLPAEMIRDNALATSGLLVNQIGGESVKPYQPEGLWKEKSTFSLRLYDYKTTKGDSLYRRSLYTFIRRTSPPPSMIAFDATSREVCTVQRENTSMVWCLRCFLPL